MKNLFYQTKQAFYFSLAFYLIALVTIILKLPLAMVLFSVALLVSMIWVLLVLREIMMSTAINGVERILLTVFLILTNVLGGTVYFLFLRNRVIGNTYKK